MSPFSIPLSVKAFCISLSSIFCIFSDLNNLLAENEYDYTDPQVLEISDKILKNDPKNIDAYYYKSAYYDVAGDIEGARKVVDEMVKNNPDLIQRFINASIEGWYNFLYGNRTAAYELIMKDNPEMTKEKLDK